MQLILQLVSHVPNVPNVIFSKSLNNLLVPNDGTNLRLNEGVELTLVAPTNYRSMGPEDGLIHSTTTPQTIYCITNLIGNRTTQISDEFEGLKGKGESTGISPILCPLLTLGDTW